MNRIFSGIQPTERLHLGNYLGAVRHWVSLQEQFNSIYAVVDLHALTVAQDPTKLAKRSREAAAVALAAGIDIKRSILFLQSMVPEHTELAWLLSCLTPLGWLNRMTQFKEKAGKDREQAGLGLYAYPVLMASDILLYKATHVPVGEDQKQHLELTRDIAGAFNRYYGVDFFPMPEPQILGSATRIMSLRDGTKKMSKSDASDYSRINLTDDADTIALKIRKAKTDPYPLPATVEELATRPEVENLVTIFAATTGQDITEVLKGHAGENLSRFKTTLTETLIAFISPLADEIQRLLAIPDHIDELLREGALRASDIARPVLSDIKRLTGFLSI